MQETTTKDKTIAVIVALLVVGLGVGAYIQNSNSSSNSNEESGMATTTEVVTTNETNKNITTNSLLTMTTTATGLMYTDVLVGTGAEAKAGNMVSVNYIGTFQDGKEFDNSYKRGQPIEFALGAQQVIAGWDEGITGMKVGGKRQLVIPASLAYGPEDYHGIPGGSTLLFDVELVGVK